MTVKFCENLFHLGALSWNNDFRVNKKLDSLIHLDGERAHLLIHAAQVCGGKVRASDCASQSLCLYYELYMAWEDFLACLRLISSQICMDCIFLLQFSFHVVDWGSFDY